MTYIYYAKDVFFFKKKIMIDIIGKLQNLAIARPPVLALLP